MFDINGKCAIITGGAGELGLAMIKGLLQAGVKMVVIDYSDDIEEKLSALSGFGEVFGIKIDISNENNRINSFNESIKILGKLDIMINCAGIQRRYNCTEFPLDEWNLVMEINLTSYFHFAQLAANYMINNNIKGRIINIASMNSYNGGFRIPAYAASKCGVVSITRSLSNELASKGITVNSIAPGYMDTSLNSLRNDPKYLSRIPMGRCGTGEDLVPALVFLSSEEANYISGITIPVDGGFLGV